jgi:hypothetical protein
MAMGAAVMTCEKNIRTREKTMKAGATMRRALANGPPGASSRDKKTAADIRRIEACIGGSSLSSTTGKILVENTFISPKKYR